LSHINKNNVNRLGYDGGGTEEGGFFRLTGFSSNFSDSRILLHSARTGLFLIGGRVTNKAPDIARFRLFDSASSSPNTDGGPFNVFSITDDDATENGDPGRLDVVAADDDLNHTLLFTSGETETDSSPDTSTQIKAVRLNTEWADVGVTSEDSSLAGK